jgi:hypothetical protein
MGSEDERHIEMTWHCSGCNHCNLGRYKVCSECSKPKQDEAYEMPANTTAAATVTDADLLRMATAGPNWRCAYCGSAQRANDGGCSQCGASPVSAPEVRAPVEAPRDVVPIWKRAWVGWTIVGLLVAVCAAIPLLVWNAHRPRTYKGTVTRVAWEQVIDVERYASRDHEGFKDEIPAGATDIVSIGQKVHHHEQVFDHTGTEQYTEQVPDGYTTETYADTSDCGKTCTAAAETCHEECTSSNNGFAKCHQVCTGGGTTCTPTPCGGMKTRQVPKTRTEIRTREVPVYRDEPRYAEAFHYKAWDWQHDRTVQSTGSDATGLTWPDNGARDSGLPDGESERETRHSRYDITIRYSDSSFVSLSVRTPAELAQFPTHSTHVVRVVQGKVYVDDRPVGNAPSS